jgi:gliding motility-associated-like protein
MRQTYLILLLLLPGLLAAQLCEGEMGVAALYDDFGMGNNFGPELPPGTTTYQYSTTYPPIPGSYYVTNLSQINGAAWHPGLDFTPGDGSGYMLVFDADEVPGEFYNRILDGLCPGTRYEFGAWISNVVTPNTCGGQSILPDVRFELRDPDSGALLASVDTGELPTTAVLRWFQYGMTFTLPPGQDAVRLLLINNAAGGCGNDVAIDDISLRICNPGRQQVVELCSGESLEINGNVYSESGLYVDTIPGAAFCHDSILVTEIRVVAPDVTVVDTFVCEGGGFVVGDKKYTEPGIYIDTLVASGGCDSIVELRLTAAELSAELTAERDTVILGEAVQLQAVGNGVGPLIWSWLPEEGLDCTDCLQPTVLPFETTNYSLTVKDSLTGCRDTLEQRITVLPCEAIFVPSAFSPNGDGRNDLFRPYVGDCVEAVASLEVYDRWGSLIYRSRGADVAWDGQAKDRPCKVGVYVYLISVRLKDGKDRLLRGELQLLR